jgi:hypothetical protein
MSERWACRLVNQPRGTQRYQTDATRGRGCTHPGHHRVRQPVRTLRLSPHHGAAEAGRLAGGQGPGGAHLASRRAESTAEAEAAQTAVVERRIVCAAEAGAQQPCMEL